MSDSEKERLAAACAGDRRAFDLLCQAYRAEIQRLCVRFLSRREDAEDAVQEVFARAWQHLATYRSEASFRTWLWEIGRNLCLNHLRARKSQLNRNTRSVEALPDAERQQTLDIADPHPSPEETALQVAQRAQIRQEITRYAAEKKWEATDWELFLLRIETDIAYAEFAQRHGREEAYWRNRWRDKIKPVLERVRKDLEKMLA